MSFSCVGVHLWQERRLGSFKSPKEKEKHQNLGSLFQELLFLRLK